MCVQRVQRKYVCINWQTDVEVKGALVGSTARLASALGGESGDDDSGARKRRGGSTSKGVCVRVTRQGAG